MQNKHGGKREGAGRKSSPYLSKAIQLSVRPDELDFILENIKSPRQRTLVLIYWIQDQQNKASRDYELPL